VQGLELVIEPAEGQGAAGHIERRYELADERLVCLNAGLSQQWRDLPEEDKQFLIFCGTKTVQEHRGAASGVRWRLGQERLDE
jgi:hypothetical protein